MKIVATSRTFREVEAGWLDTGTGHVFKTATAANAAAKRESKRNVAKAGGEVGAVTVNWEPTTRIGRIVIETIIAEN